MTLDALSAAYAQSLGASADSDAGVAESDDRAQPGDGAVERPVVEAPEPEPESEEGQVQRGLETIEAALADAIGTPVEDAVETEEPEEEEEAPVEFKQALIDLPEPPAPVVEEQAPPIEEEPEEEPEVITPPEPPRTDGDPYAQGGLLRRLQRDEPDNPSDDDRPYSSFDWRGRPVE